jgi:methylthioribose-1-phosphate isomerase
LIAIVAALGLAVEAYHKKASFQSNKAVVDYFYERFEYLRTSRPTAVNLFTATDELKATVQALSEVANATVESIVDGYVIAAEAMLEADVATNRAIGYHGAKAILEETGKEKVKVLTICNTGSLATAGFGTALGVVRALHEMGKLEHIYACEVCHKLSIILSSLLIMLYI